MRNPKHFQDLAEVYNQAVDQEQEYDRPVSFADVEDLVETIIHTEVHADDAMAYAMGVEDSPEMVEAFRTNI